MSILGNIVDAFLNFFRPDTSGSSSSTRWNLEELASKNPSFSNWKHSIVDLLKLTHPDDPEGASSMESRRKLARELGKPYYTGTAEENQWLHAEVMKKLKENPRLSGLML